MTPNTSLARRPLAYLASLLLIGALGACNIVQPAQEDPTRYFVLSDGASQGMPAAPSASGVRIGLRAVRVETYLKRHEMVVRSGDNEIQFRDYRRWAEPLEASIGRALRSQLLSTGDIAQVQLEPFPFDQPRDYDVSVDVRRCEGAIDAAGRYGASFSATIEIATTGNDAKVVVRKLFVAPAAAWDGTSYDRLASLLSADVAALGREIASSVPPKP